MLLQLLNLTLFIYIIIIYMNINSAHLTDDILCIHRAVSSRKRNTINGLYWIELEEEKREQVIWSSLKTFFKKKTMMMMRNNFYMYVDLNTNSPCEWSGKGISDQTGDRNMKHKFNFFFLESSSYTRSYSIFILFDVRLYIK